MAAAAVVVAEAFDELVDVAGRTLLAVETAADATAAPAAKAAAPAVAAAAMLAFSSSPTRFDHSFIHLL